MIRSHFFCENSTVLMWPIRIIRQNTVIICDAPMTLYIGPCDDHTLKRVRNKQSFRDNPSVLRCHTRITVMISKSLMKIIFTLPQIIRNALHPFKQEKAFFSNKTSLRNAAPLTLTSYSRYDDTQLCDESSTEQQLRKRRSSIWIISNVLFSLLDWITSNSGRASSQEG